MQYTISINETLSQTRTLHQASCPSKEQSQISSPSFPPGPTHQRNLEVDMGQSPTALMDPEVLGALNAKSPLQKFLQNQSNSTIWAIFSTVAELGTLPSVEYLGQGSQPTLGTWSCHIRCLISENADPTRNYAVRFIMEELQCFLPVPLTLDLPQTVFPPTEGFILPLPWHSSPWVVLASDKDELRAVGMGKPSAACARRGWKGWKGGSYTEQAAEEKAEG